MPGTKEMRTDRLLLRRHVIEDAAVLRYLAGEEGIEAVSAWCAADNVGSRRAMEKAGMEQVRVEKGALEVAGAVFDRLWYEFRGEVVG